MITVQSPCIEGIITNLIRGKDVRAKGPVFDALVESIATLFNLSSPHQLEQVIFEKAPSELLNLYEIVPANERWKPEMLPSFLTGLPMDMPFSVYGVAPNWVYAALAVHIGSAPMHQCDPRLGWTQPLRLSLSVEQHPEVFAREHICQDTTVLSINIPSKHLAYFQPNPLPFPPVHADLGLIVDGIVPYWLLTALVRLYKNAGIAWIATYYPQLEKAVVIYSRIAAHTPGDLVSMPT
jgi:CRISPR-associated protein Csx3